MLKATQAAGIAALAIVAALMLSGPGASADTTSTLQTYVNTWLGKIGWQNSQPTILNDWAPSGLVPNAKLWANASDNQGTMITGISSSGIAEGTVITVCNGAGPLDDGVVMLSNEDTRSQTANRILIPNTGVPGQGVELAYPIPPGGGCARLMFDEYDHVNSPGVLRWHVMDTYSRVPNATIQYLGIFPDAIANGMHGIYNDFRPGNAATAIPGAQGYSTTITVASNNQVLAGGANTYTINVANTAGFTGPGGSTTVIPITITHAAIVYSFVCTGVGSSTTFTGCGGAAVTLSTNDVVGGGLCDAGTSCLWDDYSGWTVQGTDSSTVELTGLFYGGNARPTGEGPVKVLCNAGPGLLQLDNANAGSAVADRFTFSTAANVTLQINQCMAFKHSTLYLTSWLPIDGVMPYTATAPVAVSSANVVSFSTTTATCSGAGQAVTSISATAVGTCSTVPLSLLNRQVLTATSGTYTPTSGTKEAILEMVGQGGGGGGCAGAGTGSSAGAGGSSGAYIKVYVNCAGTCTGGAYTNGHTGGAGGTAGNNAGTDGQDTTLVFNSVTYTATHGRGGAGMANATTAQSSLGGLFAAASTAADVNLDQVPGGSSYSDGAGHGMSGFGGSSPWGAGGASESSVQGGAFVSHGAGAGGAGPFCTTTSFAGGSGTNGQIIVYELG